MGTVIDFRPNRQQRGRTAAQEANDTIKPLIDTMLQMNPGDLTDFCRAICESVQYIERTKKYSYFSSSTDLACLIGANYVYNVKGHDPATGQPIRTAAAAPAAKKQIKPAANIRRSDF